MTNIQELQVQIHELEALNRNRCFEQLNDEDKQLWCQRNAIIKQNAIICYTELWKLQQKSEAVRYFNIALTLYNDEACNIFHNAMASMSTAGVHHIDALPELPNEELYENFLLLLLDNQQQRAYTWLLKMVANNYPPANFIMGEMHAAGYGLLKKDREQARIYYERAARSGYIRAHILLGRHYSSSAPQLAVQYFKTAAETGDAAGLNNFGTMCLDGQGTATNCTLAYTNFMLAALQQYKQAAMNLGMMYQAGEGVTKNYPIAFEWFKKAAEGGYRRAYYNMGYLYYHARGVERDYQKAARCMREAAEADENDAIKFFQHDDLRTIFTLHYKMFLQKYEEVSLILKERPDLIGEILWDLQRIEEGSAAWESIFAMVMAYGNHYFNDIYMYLLEVYYNRITVNIGSNNDNIFEPSDFEHILNLIDKINVPLLEEKQLINFINFIVMLPDTMEQLLDTESKAIFNSMLKKTIHQIAFHMMILENNLDECRSSLRKLLSIAVTCSFGPQYVTAFIPEEQITPNLLAAVFCFKAESPDFDYQSFNNLVGFALIKPCITKHSIFTTHMDSPAANAVTECAPENTLTTGLSP